MTLNERILDFLDGTLPADDEAELLHTLSVSPEKRNMLREFMQQRAVLSRDAKSLATSYGLALATMSHPKQYRTGETVVIIPPEHVDTFAKDGWTKDQVRAQIQAATLRPARELIRDETCAEGLRPEQAAKIGLDTLVGKFRDPSDIKLIVAGGEAGKFGAYLANWVSGPMGSIMTSVAIRE